MCAMQLRPSCLPLSFSCGTFSVKVNSRGKHAHVLSRFSRVRLFATLWAIACQAPLSMRFSRQECWSGLPCPPPRGSSWTRDWTLISYESCIGKRVLYHEHHLGSLCGAREGKKEEAFPSGDFAPGHPVFIHFPPFFLTSHPPLSPPLSWGRWGGVWGVRVVGRSPQPQQFSPCLIFLLVSCLLAFLVIVCS